MTEPPIPDWDAITPETLRNDEALREFYRDAVRRYSWPRTVRGIRTFWALAHRCQQNTEPNADFYVRVRNRVVREVTQSDLKAASRRMGEEDCRSLIASVPVLAPATPKSPAGRSSSGSGTIEPIDCDGLHQFLRDRAAEYERNRGHLEQARARVNVNEITAHDLVDTTALGALFVELARRGEVPPTDEGILRFLMAADRALARDKRGTPGALFRSMLRPETPERYFTNEAQDAALQRMRSFERAELVAEARNAALVAAPPPAAVSAPAKRTAASELKQRIGFVPSALMQVFLPQRRLTATPSHYTSTHGRAWLAVSAGIGADEYGASTRLDVPFGAYARLVLIYLCTHARTGATVTIGGLREFLAALGVPYGGSAALQVGAQVANLGACRFTLGYTRDNGAGPGPTVLAGLESMNLASGVEYAHPWKGRHASKPRPPWITEVHVAPGFRAQVLEHRAPVCLDHLAQLRKRPRAMDICMWAAYRVRGVGAKPARIPVSDLRKVFAPAMPPRKWPAALKSDLAAINRVHRFRATIRNGILVLRQSKLPVPHAE